MQIACWLLPEACSRDGRGALASASRGTLRDTRSRGSSDLVEASRGVVMFAERSSSPCWDLAFPEVPGIRADSPVVWFTVAGSGRSWTWGFTSPKQLFPEGGTEVTDPSPHPMLPCPALGAKADLAPWLSPGVGWGGPPSLQFNGFKISFQVPSPRVWNKLDRASLG